MKRNGTGCQCGYCSVSYNHCAECGYVSNRRDMVRVTALDTGRVRHVCRPTEGGQCFSRNVRTAELDAIELGGTDKNRAARRAA